jgi:eukaryotic-like serine/threonine-protein kinase
LTPERWQEVERLYHAALERGEGERAGFLTGACGGDEELRREVESLLEHEAEAEHFIDSPALEAAAKLIAREPAAALAQGQTINQYEITSALGAGGMGEVYLAKDTRLRRNVALKLLPWHFAQDRSHLRRFEQEARAVAAFSHPNVCAIYDVVDTGESRPCIVMEYVEGVSLREHMKGRRMEVTEVLDVAIQVASALSAAHAAGIVHRDIKPENIMLRREGDVKVLDFGLAKVAPLHMTDVDSRAPMQSFAGTAPGVVMGTVHYMSPEQSRGQDVDERTDTWSLGVLLYEMVAGRRPFKGTTAMDVVVSIIQRDPVPLVTYAPQIESQLERVVTKALAKDRAERYQTAKDLLFDLKSLRHDLELEEAKLTGHVSPSAKLINPQAMAARPDPSSPASPFPLGLTRKRAVIFSAFVAVVITGLAVSRFIRPAPAAPLQLEIKSLAVLPLKTLHPEASDSYLGLGMADTIITKISQVGGLTVRPTSAVRKYADQDIDSREAGRQLKVDSVLDGTFLHEGEILRVSVNLLRVEDGASLWAESFDMRFTDIFAIQDEASRQVVSKLRLRLSPAEQARLAKRQTTNPLAYDYYTKAMYHFSSRGFGVVQEEAETAVDLLEKAIELDPDFALAHAQLGFAYVWIADFTQGRPDLIASAKEQLRVAERLDPHVPEVHMARSLMAWSSYENWQIAAAIREGRLAKKLNPTLGNEVLANLYLHAGLDEQAATEFESALERDPTSGVVRASYLHFYINSARPDEWLALNQRLSGGGPNLRYYLEKRMLEEAAPLVEKELAANPDSLDTQAERALFLALQGKHSEAQAEVPRTVEGVPRYKNYHHLTYNVARIYALDGKAEEALKWLRITAQEGFPCYTLFARDPFLEAIRKDPAFIEFMVEMKGRWENYRREFRPDPVGGAS